MSSSVFSLRQARFSCQLDAARCSDELKSDEKEMSNEAIDAARRSVDMTEGDPIHYNALAKAMQQAALAVMQRLYVSFRPNFFRSARSPRNLAGAAWAVRIRLTLHEGKTIQSKCAR